MKKDNINYIAVGMFVLAMLILLLAMLYRVTGQEAGAEKYFARFDKVTGIKEGTAVTYGGYRIGHVNAIEPVNESGRTRYQLELMVTGEWNIPDDSVAQIIMPGVIADKQVEITEGISKNYFAPGATLNSREMVDMMTLVNSIGSELETSLPQLMNDASKLVKKLDDSADQLSAMLNETNRQHVGNMFRNADEASHNLARLTTGFDRINTQLDVILRDAGKLVSDNDTGIRQSVEDLRKTIESVSTNMDSIMYNLDASGRNMNEFSRQLRNNPGVILGNKPPLDEAETQQ
jgi:phospholipid/cholesterol/gamma-HCH transport system substrate-binding protein